METSEIIAIINSCKNAGVKYFKYKDLCFGFSEIPQKQTQQPISVPQDLPKEEIQEKIIPEQKGKKELSPLELQELMDTDFDAYERLMMSES